MADYLMQLTDHILVLYFADIDLEQKVDQHLFAELHVGQMRVYLFYDLHSINSQEVGIDFIDKLAYNTKKLAVDCVTLYVDKFVLKENQKQLKDVC